MSKKRWFPEFKKETDLNQTDTTSRASSSRGFDYSTKTYEARVGSGSAAYRVNKQGLYMGAEQFDTSPFNVDMNGLASIAQIKNINQITSAGTFTEGLLIKDLKYTSSGTSTKIIQIYIQGTPYYFRVNTTEADCDYLSLVNSYTYVPTTDYEPATKKYVDTGITSKCRVYLSGNQTLPAGEGTVSFDTVSYDGLSEFNTSKNYFNASTTGYYKIDAVLQVNDATSVHNIRIYKEMAPPIQVSGFATSKLANIQSTSFSISDTIQISSPTQIILKLVNGLGGNLTINGGALISYMTIHKLSGL